MPEKPKEKKEPASDKKKRLLIVEDERPLAHALELKFAHEGFETHVAVDGEAALSEIKGGKFDVILLDLIMPKMDGFTLLEEIKNKKLNAPIIVLTNLGQQEDQDRAQKLGAKGYFVKSNTPIADIVKHVKAVL